ncbi:hypothetical protein D3C86_1659130 [compost metagenome]
MADTEPATLAPRLSSLSLAISRLISSSEPVSTQVCPASGKPSTTFFSLCQCMPKSASCFSAASANWRLSSTAKNSRTELACFSGSAWRISSQSAPITACSEPNLSASFCAPPGPTKGICSLSRKPPSVVLAENSAPNSP